MEDAKAGQITAAAAEVYDQFFVPALFQQWARKVADAAQIKSGDKVLDVACGTGVLSREAASRGAKVTGLDVNEGMLAVASRAAPDIDWRQGLAEELPFDDGEFDVVVSQFGLMFFADRVAAIREMLRVLASGGRLAVAVWDAAAQQPGYSALNALIRRLFGNDAAEALLAPFVLGDRNELEALFASAGATNVNVASHPGTAVFPSMRDWLFTEIRGWTLADRIDDMQFELLVKEAEHELAQFVAADGQVVFDAPAEIVTARRE